MKYCVTGSAGFIGANLVKKLKALDHEVLEIDKVTGDDLLDPMVHYKIEKFNPDYIIHLAAISSLPECESEPVKAYMNNVVATLQLLQTARSLPNLQRFVFSSTSAVYENSDIRHRQDKQYWEDDQAYPDLIYSQTKLAGENLCQSYVENYQLPITILRLFNVFGPGQNDQRKSPPLTAYIIRELVNERVPELYCSSDVKRDYIYVDDVVDAIYYASKGNDNEIFNICSGLGYTVQQIYDTIAAFLDCSIQPIFHEPTTMWDRYPSLFNQRFNLDHERVEKEVYKQCVGLNYKMTKILGYEPKYSLAGGLLKMIEQYGKV